MTKISVFLLFFSVILSLYIGKNTKFSVKKPLTIGILYNFHCQLLAIFWIAENHGIWQYITMGMRLRCKLTNSRILPVSMYSKVLHLLMNGKITRVHKKQKGSKSMKRTRKSTAILLAAAMVMSLTACKGNSGTPATTAGGSSSETTAASSNGKAEFEINIGHINDERDSWHQGALKFKEYVEAEPAGHPH